MRFRAVCALALLTLLAVPVAASAAGGAASPSASASAAVAAAKARGARLTAFRSCAALVRYARRNGLRTARFGGAGTPPPARPMPATDNAESGGPVPASAPAAGGGRGADFSTTNVQEDGVDEPDAIKTDGTRIFALGRGALHAIDGRAANPALLGTLKLPDGGYGQEILLRGNRVLVFSNTWSYPAASNARAASSPMMGGGVSHAVLTEVDVSDPAAMRVVRTLKIDGSYLSARLHGSTARVVVNSPPRLVPVGDEPPQSREESVARHRKSVRRSRLRSWLPRAVTANRRSGRRKRRALASCRSVRRPMQFSGLDMVTVATIDLDRGLEIIDSDAVMTSAETIYGSADRLYVATRRWLSPNIDTPAELPPVTTAIHSFDLSDPERTHYRASGVVPGFVLSQWSLSEHDGLLRVASTLAPTWWDPQQVPTSESFVTVLRQSEGLLAPVGSVGGLGRGERIFAVRFIEDVGYVVTFRQTDPLYTIDLSMPSQPRVLGELKILGYSAYLHPIGDDLLLGVGQDADEQGRTQGTQLSVFDVSDLSNPARLHQRTIADHAYSAAESDHRAFLWWAPEDLAVLPVNIYDWEGGSDPFMGAIGFGVGRSAGIREVGRIEHPTQWDPIQRSMVMGNRIWTLSSGGLMASSLVGLRQQAWVAFPAPPEPQPPGPA